MKFKIQIPTNIVKSKDYTNKEFVLLLKLIQIYYMIPENEKSFTFAVKHRDLMFYSGFKDNDTFKKALKGLYEKRAILSKIENLPRTNGLEIILNEQIIPEQNKEGYFTQLSSNLLDKKIIDSVGHTGIRLLYYYQSYVNNTERKKNHCYVSEVTTAEDLGITEKTVIKYNKILKKHKLIKIEQHEIEQVSFTTKKGNELYQFKKYNNHYYIRYENIDDFGIKLA